MRRGWIVLALALAGCAAEPEPPMHMAECSRTPSGEVQCVEFDIPA